MELIDYIYDECHRQHVINYGDFAKAWQIAVDRGTIQSSGELAIFVMRIARAADYANLYRTGEGENLRTSHVGFMNGGSAAPVNEVRPKFDRWCQVTFDHMSYTVETGSDKDVATIDLLIKQLLEIHPWVDGNGRTASILRNWMLNRLDDPEPLPYYEF